MCPSVIDLRLPDNSFKPLNVSFLTRILKHGKLYENFFGLTNFVQSFQQQMIILIMKLFNNNNNLFIV